MATKKNAGKKRSITKAGNAAPKKNIKKGSVKEGVMPFSRPRWKVVCQNHGPQGSYASKASAQRKVDRHLKEYGDMASILEPQTG